MPVAPGDVAQVTFVGRHHGQTTMNTFHYRTNDTNSADSSVIQTNLANQLRAGVGGGDVLETAFLNCCAQDYTLQQIWVQIVRSVRYAASKIARSVPGNVLVDSNATNISGVITRRAALAGRAFVGSIHMPAVPDTYYSNGDISGTYLAALSAMATASLQVVTDTGLSISWLPCLLHRTAPLTSTFLSTAFVQTNLRVMRRRTVGLGI